MGQLQLQPFAKVSQTQPTSTAILARRDRNSSDYGPMEELRQGSIAIKTWPCSVSPVMASAIDV